MALARYHDSRDQASLACPHRLPAPRRVALAARHQRPGGTVFQLPSGVDGISFTVHPWVSDNRPIHIARYQEAPDANASWSAEALSRRVVVLSCRAALPALPSGE